eukprot:GHVS01019227.1.p1 GENE.GHVS01019227.1~~GHVS01019227.1.p1  ORF type:complete len:179 (-),score=48.77 GHVS01019227.1:174-710(-)
MDISLLSSCSLDELFPVSSPSHIYAAAAVGSFYCLSTSSCSCCYCSTCYSQHSSSSSVCSDYYQSTTTTTTDHSSSSSPCLCCSSSSSLYASTSSSPSSTGIPPPTTFPLLPPLPLLPNATRPSVTSCHPPHLSKQPCCCYCCHPPPASPISPPLSSRYPSQTGQTSAACLEASTTHY